MKNFILCVILALVAIGCAGTGEEAVGTSEDTKSAIEANYQRQNELALKLACEDFKAYDYAKVQGKEADFSHKIVDYEKGLIAVAQKVWGDSAVNYKETTCQKLKKLKNIKSETRKFAYNDFSVNITKHINLYEKVLNGEVVERAEIAKFEVEPIEVIEYEGVIYKANSKKVENLRKSLKNEYLKEQKRITRENSQAEKDYENKVASIKKNQACFELGGACFEMGGKKYCDGDIININKSPLQIIIYADKVGSNSATFSLYYYRSDNIAREVTSQFYEWFKMQPPSVNSNANLHTQKYCDGDLVRVYSNSRLMVRVDKTGYGSVMFKLYHYNENTKKPIAQASGFYDQFKMQRPGVYGNHYINTLKEPILQDIPPLKFLPEPHLLQINELENFEEW